MSQLQRILHVNDKPDIRELVEIVLTSVGDFNVLSCGSGSEAIEKAADFNPELFLLDLMMPGMDGVDTMRGLVDIPALRAVPAIFLTARAQPSDIDDLKAKGAIDVIGKPFSPMELSDQVSGIWKRWQFPGG